MPKAIKGAHEAILSAASRLLAAEGYDRLNMRAIAVESGVATGTIYNYYKAKDEIVFALMQHEWEELLPRLDAIACEPACPGASEPAAPGATVAILGQLFVAMHGFASRYAPVWRLMALVPREEMSPAVRNYRIEDYAGEIEDRIAKILTAMGDAGPEPAEVRPLASLINRIFSVYSMDAEPDAAAMELLLRKLLRP
jgi:AcrR family transcriptional regulator